MGSIGLPGAAGATGATGPAGATGPSGGGVKLPTCTFTQSSTSATTLCSWTIPPLISTSQVRAFCCYYGTSGTGALYSLNTLAPHLYDNTNNFQLSFQLMQTGFVVGNLGCEGETVIGGTNTAAYAFSPIGNGLFVVSENGAGLADSSLVYTSSWILTLQDGGVVSGNSYSATCDAYYLV